MLFHIGCQTSLALALLIAVVIKVKLNKMYIWNLGMKKGMKSRTECVETRTEGTYVYLEKQTCQN